MKTLITAILILVIVGSMSMVEGQVNEPTSGFAGVSMYDTSCVAERQVYSGDRFPLVSLDFSAEALGEISYANIFIFTGANNEEIGRLYLDDPMRFEGNAEESAKMFFEYVIKVQSNNRLLPELQHPQNE